MWRCGSTPAFGHGSYALDARRRALCGPILYLRARATICDRTQVIARRASLSLCEIAWAASIKAAGLVREMKILTFGFAYCRESPHTLRGLLPHQSAWQCLRAQQQPHRTSASHIHFAMTWRLVCCGVVPTRGGSGDTAAAAAAAAALFSRRSSGRLRRRGTSIGTTPGSRCARAPLAGTLRPDCTCSARPNARCQQ